jgi:folylpolyglutamate synthase/dihydropteroate synthase
MPADALAEAWREALPGARVEVVREPAAALDLALAAAGGPIVVAGSLYLVGAARARLVDDPALRDPVAA